MQPQIVTLLINILLCAFILFGFLGGLRGIKKSVFSLVSFLIQVIIIFFISPLISKLILNINISGNTVNNHIINALSNFAGSEIASSDFVNNLIYNLTLMIANVASTILLLIVFSIIFKIINAIVYKLMFKKEKQDYIEKCEIVNGTPQMVKKPVKKKKKRFYGALVGSVHGFLFAIVLFLPIFGAVNVFNKISGVGVAVAETQGSVQLKSIKQILNDELPKDVFNYVNALEDSIFYKIGSVGGISEGMFNLVASTSINGNNVQLGNEILTLTNVYDLFVEFANSANSSYEDFDFQTFLNDLKNNPKNYNFDKAKKVIDKLFESNLINAVANDAIVFAGDTLVNGADENFMPIALRIKTALHNYAMSGASIKSDIKSTIDLLELSLENGLVKTLESNNLKIEDLANVLLNEESELKPKNALLNGILNKATDSVLLQKIVLEFINYGVDELEDIMNKELHFLNNYQADLSTINTTRHYTIKPETLEEIVVDGYNLYKEINELDTDAISKDFYEIFGDNVNLQKMINYSGSILNNIVSMSIFKDTGVFSSICSSMSETEYNRYIDFNKLKTQNAIEIQFGYFAEAVNSFKESGIISVVREANDDNKKQVIKDVITKLSVEDTQGTYVSKILNPLLKCTVFKNGVEFALNEALIYIEAQLKEKNSITALNKFNTNNLMDESENGKFIDMINNLVQFSSGIDFDNLLTSNFIDELLKSSTNFDNLGRAMNSIKTSTLFSDYYENGIKKEGVYKCILNSLSGIEIFEKYFDLSVAKEENFDWVDASSKLKTITNDFNDIQIQNTPLIKYLLTNSDYSIIISELRDWINDAPVGEEREVKLNTLFELSILKPTAVKIVNVINSKIKEFVDSNITQEENKVGTNIVDITNDFNLQVQAQDINKIINKALIINFDEISKTGIDNISDDNLELVKDLINEMSINAESETYEGVFKQSYNALLLKTINVINNSVKTMVGSTTAGSKITTITTAYDLGERRKDVLSIINNTIDYVISDIFVNIDIKTVDVNDYIKFVKMFENNFDIAGGIFKETANALYLYAINTINKAVASETSTTIEEEYSGETIADPQSTADILMSAQNLFKLLNGTNELKDLIGEKSFVEFVISVKTNDLTVVSYYAIEEYLNSYGINLEEVISN